MGALTSKFYSFQARVWEISSYEIYDSSDSLVVPIFANFRGTEFLRILPKIRRNSFVFGEWISDRTRFSYGGYKYQRFVRPLFRNCTTENFSPVSWRMAMSIICSRLLDSRIYKNFYLSTRVDLQACFALRSLLFSLRPYSYDCITTSFNFFSSGFDPSDFSISLSSTYFSSFNSICFVGYDFNSALPLLDFEFTRSFFKADVEVFTAGSNVSFFDYSATSLGLSNTSFFFIIRGKSRFSRFFSKKTSLKIFFSINSFDSFVQIIFIFSKKFLSPILKFYYSFELSQTILSSSPMPINFFSIFNSFSLRTFSNFYSRKKNVLHYFIGYVPIRPIKFTLRDFVIYQGSNYSESVKFANLILPSFFPLEEKSTHINIFGEKRSSSGLPVRPELINCRSHYDIFYNLTSTFSLFSGRTALYPYSFFNHYFSSFQVAVYHKQVAPETFKFQFSPSSIFSFTSPLFFFYQDLLSQISAPLALQAKMTLRVRSYVKF